MDVKQLEKDFLTFKAENEIFDINCVIPCHLDVTLEDKPAAPEIYFNEGVDKMVLSSTICMRVPYHLGNEIVFDAAAKDDRFYASAAVAPDMNLGGRNFAAEFEKMLEKKTVIARMFPKAHKYQLRKWLVDDVLSELERRRVPLMVWHMQIEWDELAEIAEAYPNLPIIIEGSDQKTVYYAQSVMGLCEKYHNVHLEMHNFTHYDFFHYALKYIGADRLIFGSRSPFNDMNVPLYQILMNANEEERKLILSGNIKRLISEIR